MCEAGKEILETCEQRGFCEKITFSKILLAERASLFALGDVKDVSNATGSAGVSDKMRKSLCSTKAHI